MKKYKGKAIYQPSGKAAEYAEWACNFYVGCSNGCEYCYCKKGILAGVMGQDKPQLKKCFYDESHALEIFTKEVNKNIADLQEHGLFFSFTTDPMLEETKRLTIFAISHCIYKEIPVKILTKCTDWIDSFFLSIRFNRFYPIETCRKYIAFGFTLTGHDELEPNASTNQERITTMSRLHDAGFKTFASIEPIIDSKSAMDCIEATLGFCDLYKIGLMSGKKYDKLEAINFIEWLYSMIVKPKIYLKESIRKLTGFNPLGFGENFVERDYKL